MSSEVEVQQSVSLPHSTASRITPKSSKPNFTFEFKKKSVTRAIELGNTCAASREIGVSKSVLAHWVQKYKQNGEDGLINKTRRPHHQPKKTSQWVIDLILGFKKDKPEVGASQCSDHFKRNKSIDLSATTVRKIFRKHNLPDGDAGYAEQSHYTKGDAGKKLEQQVEKELDEWERFSRPNPNDLWQMDIMSFYIRDAHKVYLISALVLQQLSFSRC